MQSKHTSFVIAFDFCNAQVCSAHYVAYLICSVQLHQFVPQKRHSTYKEIIYRLGQLMQNVSCSLTLGEDLNTRRQSSP